MSAPATSSFTSVNIFGVGVSWPVRAGDFVRATSPKPPAIISKDFPEELTVNPDLLKSLRKVHATFKCQLTTTAFECLGTAARRVHEPLELPCAPVALKSATMGAHRKVARLKEVYEIRHFGRCAKLASASNRLLEVGRIALESHASGSRPAAPHSLEGNLA